MKRIVCLAVLIALAACGGGGDSSATGDGGCTGNCAITTPTFLTALEVQRIVSQAVQEAQVRGQSATIAVVDRVGNVLVVFRMNGALPTATIDGGRGVVGGLEGASVGSEYAAISKAITGAYLSSEGNAFTTRTASQIVQQHFNPGELGAPGGPLFGVQFSSLSCSDISAASAGTAGPKSAPLGLSADPGGLPLYKNGTVVGGIGVMADGIYGLDLDVTNIDQNLDELVAVAGARGFDAPVNRRANRITVDGRSLRYVDSEAIASNPAAAPAFSALPGNPITVPGYKSTTTPIDGKPWASTQSGIRADNTAQFSGLNAYVIDDGTGVNRFPVMAGTDGLMTQAEVGRILAEAMRVANRARAQIRLPLGFPAQVSISVVDTRGNILGLIRTPDAPLFGTDVAVQKARSALLFSAPGAAAALNAVSSPIAVYVTNMQALIPGGLTNGIAYSNRAIGNLARPFLPDGIDGAPPGPLSKSITNWSPFTDGLQLDLAAAGITSNLGADPLPAGTCSTVTLNGSQVVRNGIQIFPGSVPIFRGTTLVGAIGVSGDGIDQDDMVAFLGLANAGNALGTGIANAPSTMRADRITVPGGQLRYVSCPVAPFLDTSASNVCDGI